MNLFSFSSFTARVRVGEIGEAMKKISITKIILITTILLLLSIPAHAQSRHGERIIDYQSDITIHEDSTMTVTETIKVFCEGKKIKRGIYREFPTKYEDNWGNQIKVGFDVLSVKRNGQPEPYHIKSISNGKALYIGKEDVFLQAGRTYIYTIRYKTNRQLGYFDDHDELYWNVTGNGWEFVIEKATATVTLPDGISSGDIKLLGYTGPKGATGKSFTARIDDAAGKPYFETTGNLMPWEGLTMVVEFPKGFVHEPTSEEKLQYFLQDNRAALIGIIALFLLLGYYMLAWAKVGKDMPKGVIIPQFNPPDNFSPASVRYVKRMGYDNKVFASLIINLAVKGVVNISDTNGIYTLTRQVSPEEFDQFDLRPEETAITDKLLGVAESIILKKENHADISSTIRALVKKLKDYYQNRYFVTNSAYMVPGILITLFGFIAMAESVTRLGSPESVMSFVMGSVFGSVGFGIFISVALPKWISIFKGRGGCLTAIGPALFGTFFLIMFGGFGIMMMYLDSSIFLGLFVAAFVVINYIYYHLLKAPTLEGRRILDHIEGFKMFLSFAEKDRLNMMNPPEKTPELFEKYLPYALALDVEQNWSEEFSEVLAQASQGEKEYSPSWYSGSAYSSFGAGGFASSIGNSVSSAISSSSTAPGSSSGGRGSSGGGGGGGGGGGW